MHDTTFSRLKQEAGKLGTANGKDDGAWVIDGNTSEATARECLRMDDDGDPEWWDRFGPSVGPLSGEYADGMTPYNLIEALDGDPEMLGIDEICTAYEDAYNDAWHAEVIRAARYIVFGEDHTEPRSV